MQMFSQTETGANCKENCLSNDFLSILISLASPGCGIRIRVLLEVLHLDDMIIVSLRASHNISLSIRGLCILHV